MYSQCTSFEYIGTFCTRLHQNFFIWERFNILSNVSKVRNIIILKIAVQETCLTARNIYPYNNNQSIAKMQQFCSSYASSAPKMWRIFISGIKLTALMLRDFLCMIWYTLFCLTSLLQPIICSYLKTKFTFLIYKYIVYTHYIPILQYNTRRSTQNSIKNKKK
jgi:hypothetical protein